MPKANNYGAKGMWVTCTALMAKNMGVSPDAVGRQMWVRNPRRRNGYLVADVIGFRNEVALVMDDGVSDAITNITQDDLTS